MTRSNHRNRDTRCSPSTFSAKENRECLPVKPRITHYRCLTERARRVRSPSPCAHRSPAFLFRTDSKSSTAYYAKNIERVRHYLLRVAGGKAFRYIARLCPRWSVITLCRDAPLHESWNARDDAACARLGELGCGATLFFLSRASARVECLLSQPLHEMHVRRRSKHTLVRRIDTARFFKESTCKWGRTTRLYCAVSQKGRSVGA